MGNGNADPEEKRLIQEDQPKQPYTKPAFRFEKVFVTTALSCGKTDPTQIQCTHNTKVS
ncbi:MAG: hypothetical protein WAN03_17440 [Candidatus Sulfotelmatobacter sp.]